MAKPRGSLSVSADPFLHSGESHHHLRFFSISEDFGFSIFGNIMSYRKVPNALNLLHVPLFPEYVPIKMSHFS
jgi:hypothetical protein